MRMLLLALLHLPLLAVSAPSAPSGPEIRVVIIHRPGPRWNPALPVMQQPGIRDHIAHYQALLEQGKLFAGGPFLDGAGGIMISLPGGSLEELKAYAESDPAVKSGLLVVEVHPWLVGLRASGA